MVLRHRRSLRAVGDTQLPKELLVVPLDSFLAQVEPVRDLAVGEPVGEQAKNLAFAWGERLDQR